MVLLDKRRTALWIKIGASLLALTFILSFIPALRDEGARDFFKSLFVAGGEPTQQQEILKLKQVLEKNPKDLASLIGLGNLYYDTGKPAEAITYYQRALDIDPKNVDVRVDMGTCYFELKDYDKAMEAFTTATEQKPDHATAWYNMGVVFRTKGDQVSTKYAWTRFLAVEPTGDRADQVRRELGQ